MLNVTEATVECSAVHETTKPLAIDSNYHRLLWLWFIQKAEITLQLPFASYAISSGVD